MSAASFHNCLIFEYNELGANAGPPVHFSKKCKSQKMHIFSHRLHVYVPLQLAVEAKSNKINTFATGAPHQPSCRCFFLEEKFQFSWKYTVVFSSPNNVVNISGVMACSMKTTHSTRGKSYENGLSPFARVPSCNVLLLIYLTLAPRQRFLCVFILVAFL